MNKAGVALTPNFTACKLKEMIPETATQDPHLGETLEGSFSALSTPILHPNTHFAAFLNDIFEIYKISILLNIRMGKA